MLSAPKESTRSPRCSSSSSRTAFLLTLGLGILIGCRFQVEGAEDAIVEIAGDTLRLDCSRGPALAHRQRIRLPFVAERLLTSDGNLLAVAKGGTLHAYDDDSAAWVPVLRGGKDYDARGETLVRLRRETVDFFRYDSGRRPIFLRSLPAASHDYAVALGDRSLFLHSPANPSNTLAVERDSRSGEPLASFLHVERNLLQLVLGDLDAILTDAGSVRATGAGFAFVPHIRDPIEVVRRGRRTVLFLAGRSRGTIRTVSKTTVSQAGDERPCPSCTARREVTTRQEVHRLYADATIEGGALWILRLDPPGGGRGSLVRYSLEPEGATSVRSWSIEGFGSPIRAMTIWREGIVVADDHTLYTFDLHLEGGVECRNALP